MSFTTRFVIVSKTGKYLHEADGKLVWRRVVERHSAKQFDTVEEARPVALRVKAYAIEPLGVRN